ncbi:DUF1801 domain-containing protein [Blastococcus litoris]|uniref:DUF1801 domain-containing protein n=1 Tax=Blastococcus litoris TaxID=2171622 RepID=UPI0013DFB65D|nr:DUF1801 domain-containing protein [Blastococcus litoris]
MAGDPLEEYLALYDEAAGRLFVELDGAIRAAAPELDSAIKYRLLSYTVERDWRHWVCAVNATKSAVCLRFLWGVLLDDPLGVLRPGTSTLMTWDIPRGGEIDTAAVGGYVREALDRREHFLANADEISAAARERYGR